MFCTKCGTQLPDDACFCSKCGTQVGGVGVVATTNNVVPVVSNPVVNTIDADLQRARAAGDIDAELQVAFKYAEGDGVEMNLKKAAEIIFSVAQRENVPEQYQRGLAYAQREVGRIYKDGTSFVTQDLDKAIYWLSKSNENGDVHAYPLLGYAYYEKAWLYGKDSDSYDDYMDKAFNIFDEIANAEDIADFLKEVQAEVQCTLGKMYLNGEGIDEDEDEALEWLEKSGDNGYAYAYTVIGDYWSKEEEYDDAREYYEKAYDAREPYGCLWFGLMCQYGLGGDQNDRLANSAYNFARQSGYQDILNELQEIQNGKYAHLADGYDEDDDEYITYSDYHSSNSSSNSGSGSGIGKSIAKGIGGMALGFAGGMIASAFGASEEDVQNISYNISRNVTESDDNCFITTAVCQSLNAPDDCKELTAIRGFRDGYLRAESDGDALIKEYYKIGPQIVSLIDNDENPREVYSMLWQKYISVCYDYIQQGRFAETKQVYIDMVLMLCKRYGVEVQAALCKDYDN